MDEDAIAELVRTFFAAFTSGSVGFDRLRAAFLPQAVIVRTCGGEPAVYDVDGFIEPRRALLTDGTLTGFREWPLDGHTEIFGDVAHHFGGYAKQGVRDGEPFTGRGRKTMQFVRTADGWRISAVAWDDERPGLRFDAPRTLSTPAAIVAGTFAGRPQPVLPAAGGLLLRPWEPSDAPAFLGAYRDPEIRRWHTRGPASEEQVLEWFERYRRDWVAETGGHWAVTRDGGEVLGRIALRHWDLDDGVAGCAYWMLPAARGAGVATRALNALSGWALGEAGFHRLFLDHSTRNLASCRVAVKAGFRLEGTKRSDAVHADGRHDMHLHARIRGDG